MNNVFFNKYIETFVTSQYREFVDFDFTVSTELKVSSEKSK